MKKTIITILLALVSMVGQGQTEASALIRGRIINVPKGHEDRLTIHYTEPLQTMSSEKSSLCADRSAILFRYILVGTADGWCRRRA